MGARFEARLTRREGIFTGAFSLLPPGLVLEAVRWSEVAVGGCETATVEARGSRDDVAQLLTWVGARVEVVNEMGSPVWWGVVEEVEARLGAVQVRSSLEGVANRVAVLYSETLADGSTRTAQTGWGEDGNSSARYGRRELLYSLTEGYGVGPETVRDRLLARLADPAPVVSSGAGGEVGATLYCRGLWWMMEGLYTNETGGLIEQTAGGSELLVDAAFVSTAETLVRFTAADDIFAPAGTLTALQPGVTFRVAGAAAAGNNGVFTVQSFEVASGEDHIETIENTQVTAAGAADITISLGAQPWVERVAQAFVPTVALSDVGVVGLLVGRVGNPADDLVVEICGNSGGNPGTVLKTLTLAGASVPTALAWVELPVGTRAVSDNTTPNWLVVRRSGAESLSNYFVVGVDEGLGYGAGAMKVYVGGAWVAAEPDADLAFRVVGMMESTARVDGALGVAVSQGVLTGRRVGVASGVDVRMYRPELRTVRQEVEEMMELGTAAGERLVARVTPEGVAVVEVAADDGGGPALGEDGTLRYASGGMWEPGRLVAGRYVRVDGLPTLDGVATRTRGAQTVFVTRAEYDARGGRVMIESEGAVDPWAAVRLTRG